MLSNSYRISRVQKTLEWFEQDIPFLNMRVKDLSAERQRSAKQFAAAVISQTRAELQRLIEEEKNPAGQSAAKDRIPEGQRKKNGASRAARA